MTEELGRRALELAAAAAREAGLEPAGAIVLRVAAAVTVELPRAAAVARVEAPRDLSAAEHQVAAARLCERRRVPAARLVAARLQPLVFADGIVTLWRRLRILDGTPGPEEMGRLARRLHRRCAADLPPDTPELDPFQPIAGWLDRPCGTPEPPGTDWLRERVERLRGQWPGAIAEDPLGTTLVHGDFHADNVVLTADGPVMLDLEMAGRGPASWDLVGQQVAVLRYGRPVEEFHRFCAAYGSELPDWPGVALLRESYELHLTGWAVGHRDLSPAMAEQAAVRVASLRGETDRSWTLL